MKNNNSYHENTKRFRWIARVWGALVLVIGLFILFGYLGNLITIGTADPYAVEDYPPIENLPPLFMFLSALGLGIAWRWERLGGMIAILFQIANLPVLLLRWPLWEDFTRYLIAPYGLSLIIVIPGVLFLVTWRRSQKQSLESVV